MRGTTRPSASTRSCRQAARASARPGTSSPLRRRRCNCATPTAPSATTSTPASSEPRAPSSPPSTSASRCSEPRHHEHKPCHPELVEGPRHAWCLAFNVYRKARLVTGALRQAQGDNGEAQGDAVNLRRQNCREGFGVDVASAEGYAYSGAAE